MKSDPTVKRILFASSPLVFGLIAAVQAGCSSDTGTGNAGAGAPAPIVKPIPPAPIDPSDNPKVDLPGFKGSASCQKCHTTIYNEWVDSMHAHAVTSPVTIAQANELFARDLIMRDKPDPQWFCVNCHSPTSTLYGQDGRLPFVSSDPARFTNDALKEGIGCVACHSYAGDPQDARAAVSDFLDDFSVGKTYYGPFLEPANNGGFHNNTATPLFLSGAEQMCLNCHNVKLDRDGDAVFELGVDLFLQTTFDEYEDLYRQGGGEATCLDCHMPVNEELQQAADGFPSAPFGRTVHNHAFAGVDYPLDEVVKQGKDPQRSLRQALLQQPLAGGQGTAASLQIKNVVFNGVNLTFDVDVTNQNSGHRLPTGFAFTRQMWVEVVVTDQDGDRLAQSGQLQDGASDLCDNDTITDSLGNLVSGCPDNKPDPQLVNFQAKLVDFVALQNGVLIEDPLKGQETWLQFQSGGAVGRVRPVDGQTLVGLNPFETRTFGYVFTVAQQMQNITLGVTLKFRNLPPYFMRRLAQGDQSATGLKGLLSGKAFQVTDMVTQFQTIQIQ